MIRQLFITLLFFFGPALLTIVIRHLVILLHLAMQRRRHPDIIDITPESPGKAPRWFVVAALLIGFVCAWLAWWALADSPAPATRYQPAHMDASGKIIPGRHIIKEQEAP